MNHTEILNRLISCFSYTSYLEIGVANGVNFRSVNLPSYNKTGVDPDCAFNGIHKMPSDEFFASNQKTFDLIFIDGLHYQEQVYRDIKNSLNVLKPCGTIVCHDINPSTFDMQVVPRKQSAWTGDCWKAWVRLRAERADLEMSVVDTDFGCGIIRRGHQKLLKVPLEMDWSALVANRQRWLNLVSVRSFLSSFPPPNDSSDAQDQTKATNYELASKISVKPVIHYASPYDTSKCIGRAYNLFMSMLPRTAFACLVDADAAFTIPDYGHLIERAIVENPDVRLFVATTNRIGCPWQQDNEAPTSDDMRDHRKYGQEIASRFGTATKEISCKSSPASGFFILLRKDLWNNFKFKEEGMLTVDNDFFRRVLKSGERILQLRGIYLYHWYRGGNRRDTSHLRYVKPLRATR